MLDTIALSARRTSQVVGWSLYRALDYTLRICDFLTLAIREGEDVLPTSHALERVAEDVHKKFHACEAALRTSLTAQQKYTAGRLAGRLAGIYEYMKEEMN